MRPTRQRSISLPCLWIKQALRRPLPSSVGRAMLQRVPDPPPPSLFHLSRTESGPSTSPLWHHFKMRWSPLGEFFPHAPFQLAPKHTTLPLAPYLRSTLTSEPTGEATITAIIGFAVSFTLLGVPSIFSLCLTPPHHPRTAGHCLHRRWPP
jgi:hypothetical protein